ncbi:MAG: sulfatase [Planctomycetaceae bacterium]|nr:sulfatase [Planctomycetaceae bacterium]
MTRPLHFLCVTLAVLAACGTRCSAAEPHPNVLLIITDEHNFRTLGCYREHLEREQAEMWGLGAVVETPHLDRIAHEGVLCTRAYATSPVCSPCRAAMMTGRYPHVVGVPTNDRVLDRSAPTLADRLNAAGYRSTFIGKWHLGGTGKPEWAPKVDGGFQHTTFMFNRGHWKNFTIRNGQPAIGAMKKGQPTYDVNDADEKSFSTDWLTDRAIEFMTDTSADQPFLTVISYPDPHGPNTVRAPYDSRFDNLAFSPPRTYRTGTEPPGWLGGGANHPVFRGPDMARYFGMVQCIDDNVGRLLEALERAGKLNQTLIIMTSDHGDLCYEHDRQNKGNPYEGSARVPLLLRQPGRIAAGNVYTQPVGTVDVTPTVIGLLGLPSDSADQGRNLSTELADADSVPLSPDPRPVTFLRSAGEAPNWIAAVDSRYKLILSVGDSPWLFDSVEDPDELRNLFGLPETREVSQRLADALREYGSLSDDPQLKHPRIAAALKTLLP